MDMLKLTNTVCVCVCVCVYIGGKSSIGVFLWATDSAINEQVMKRKGAALNGTARSETRAQCVQRR